MHSTKPPRSTLLMMGRSYRSRSNAIAFSAMGLTDSVKAVRTAHLANGGAPCSQLDAEPKFQGDSSRMRA